jgi:vancomycin aglycone glucosyltransferase
MRILLSAIGSRGDVQPLLALAVELKSFGHLPRIAVPPNFAEWIESYGVPCIPIGPDVRKLTGGTAPAKQVKPSPAQMQQMAEQMVRYQLQVLMDAAADADIVVGVGALQIATPSVAEARGLPYVYATYCPQTLPSPDHPPPKAGGHYPQTLPGVVNRLLWRRDEQSFNKRFRKTLNEEREKIGLAPIESVRPHIFTARPWLEADPILAPAPAVKGIDLVQTAAWMLSDPSPLPHDLERFLNAGDLPIYFGLGSMRALQQSERMFVEAARAVGRRAIVQRGWAELDASAAGDDCLAIGDVDHAKLFPRCAAIVHHGGSGTTTTAARSGRPQVVVPHMYDQFYFAQRVKVLGVGIAGPTRNDLNGDALASALRACLQVEKAERAGELGALVVTNGAQVAAQRLASLAREPIAVRSQSPVAG